MSDTEDIKEINLENEESDRQNEEGITETNKSKNTEQDQYDNKNRINSLKSNSGRTSSKNISGDNNDSSKSKLYPESNIQTNAEEWLLMRVGLTPKNSIGWFRCGVGFYNKKEYTRSIECFEKSIEYDPLNVRRRRRKHLYINFFIIIIIFFFFFYLKICFY